MPTAEQGKSTPLAPAGALSVSVVIPVLNAERYLPELLNAIFEQDPPPMEVILVDSMSTDKTVEIANGFDRVRTIPIHNFSHGRGRNFGIQAASGDVVVLLTQDALPADEHWLAELLAPFADSEVGAVYSRQIPRSDANPMEHYFLTTHFSLTGSTQEAADPQQELAFQKDVFFSNVSGAARRDLLLRHPFDEELIMSEDQQFARDILQAGYRIVYNPESAVLHSHNYTLRVVFKRYFDSVYSLTQLFSQHDLSESASMGVNYLLHETRHMLRHHPLWFPYYILYTAAKTGGTLAAHYAERMPDWLLKRCSLHAYHWNQHQTTS